MYIFSFNAQNKHKPRGDIKNMLIKQKNEEFLLTGTPQTPHKITAPHLAGNPHRG